MAFDGIVVANLAYELKEKLINGRISKIAQPETDELLLTVKSASGQYRLLISADASLPLLYLTDTNKPSPMTAPNFCMLLRKQISGGRIVDIYQPGLERIIHFKIEHLDELGDLCRKELIIEIMGKHSNIIFCSEDGKIIDSIKHVSAQMSSVREVLPGRDYFVPDTMSKADPLTVSFEEFSSHLTRKPMPVSKAIYTSFTGISPVTAEEICSLAEMDSSIAAKEYSEDLLLHLYTQFSIYLSAVKEHTFTPVIYFNGSEPKEFAALPLSHFSNYMPKEFSSISQVLETYYATRNQLTRIRQKSADLRHVINTLLERNRKKYDLQKKQLKDTDKREKYKVYGELIHTYGYQLEEGCKGFDALNYYTNETIHIPLDATISPLDNAKKYFDRYAKLKRTYEALTDLIEDTQLEIDHLDSIATALDIAETEADLQQIKEEMMESGYIKHKYSKKKTQGKSRPYHYRSTDGFDIYVGKNNFQNDELTFKFAEGNDWWFHAKGMPGSHVLVKTKTGEMPDRTFEEAGRLAAFYSKGRGNEKVEIDYLQKKNVKKPNKAKPGFVVYYTNYSLTIQPDITGLELVSE